MKSAKYQIQVNWLDGAVETFDATNYTLHENNLTFTRQVENQTSSFLAALTSEETMGIPLAHVRSYTIKG